MIHGGREGVAGGPDGFRENSGVDAFLVKLLLELGVVLGEGSVVFSSFGEKAAVFGDVPGAGELGPGVCHPLPAASIRLLLLI